MEVTSNIWGTKFKIHGLAKTVPANLGQVTYKTSLLHLQPRQMTLVITELRDDFPTGPDPNFNPNLFSEDEDEPAVFASALETEPLTAAIPSESKSSSMVKRIMNDNTAPPIAPMSPRPGRILARHKNSNGCAQAGIGMSPLAKAESYDDESPIENAENGNPCTSSAAAAQHGSSNNAGKVMRPKNITTSTPGGRSITGPSYSSFKNSYSRSNSNSSCQSRHAISPLYCESSVPTLQSPKNAVAPTDIIFERPAVSAAGQTTLMSYSSSADYANSVVQVKNALMQESMRSNNCHVNPVPLNLNLNLERMDAGKLKANAANTKRKDIQYIDEETQSPTLQAAAAAVASSSEMRMKRTPTVVSIAPALPDVITRSCSVGYLDSVAITPSDEALTALRKEAPNKRLILVDNRKYRKKKAHQEVSTSFKLLK